MGWGSWNRGGSKDYERLRQLTVLCLIHSPLCFSRWYSEKNDRETFHVWQAKDHHQQFGCQGESFWTWFEVGESEDLRCHEGPVSYMWCSSCGQPVSLDLQLVGKEEATSHLVTCAWQGGDSRWSWRVHLWEMCVPVGEGGTVWC